MDQTDINYVIQRHSGYVYGLNTLTLKPLALKNQYAQKNVEDYSESIKGINFFFNKLSWLCTIFPVSQDDKNYNAIPTFHSNF